MLKTTQMQLRTANSLSLSLSNKCDICGKRRGGGKPVSHAKCARIRSQR